jgi:hypothetical protein
MAKFELKFIDTFGKTFIEVNKKTVNLYTKNKDIIEINLGGFNGESFWIMLDKSTAIKFAKTLRTEINKITESEVKDAN